MASEHVLTLKAQLDTSDIKAKLSGLDAGGGSGGGGGSATSGLDNLAKSIRGLKNALGVNVISHSFAELAKQTKMFGDRTDQVVTQVSGSINRISAACMTGNPALIAFAIALEAMSFGAAEAARQLAEAQKGLTEIKQRVQTWKDEKTAEDWRQYNDKSQSIANYGSRQDILSRLQADLKRRDELQAQKNQMLEGGATLDFKPENIKKLNSEIDNLTKSISLLETGLQKQNQDKANQMLEAGDITGLRTWLARLQAGGGIGNEDFDKGTAVVVKEALKKAEKKDAERVKDLEEAQADFKTSQADRIALKGKDWTYFQTVMETAAERMKTAATASEYSSAASRYEYAQGVLDQNMKETTVKDYSEMLQQLAAGASTSGFSSAGFGMGETMDQLGGIENQIDQIIRLMQDQMRKDLQLVNTETTL